MGAWTVCRFKRGLGKKRRGVFEGVGGVGWGVDAPMHTMDIMIIVHRLRQ